MNPIKTLTDKILGRRIAGSDERHRPSWFPKHFDKRWFNERIAVMDLPPYKPPYRRYGKFKAWVNVGPLSRHLIVEVDMDERKVNVEHYS